MGYSGIAELINLCNRVMKLAPYACTEQDSVGRMHPELLESSQGCFQRDRNRILHSLAFRRLEYKTQVFINYIGDHYRTRLTHSLEVAQVARDISRALQLHEDLAEAVALAHDLGHPPFGHAGEEGLNIAAASFGGFDHNAQAIKLVTLLEQRYVSYPGLNLSWETLEGIAKHNGPLLNNHAGHNKVLSMLQPAFVKFAIPSHTFPTLEAQVAAISDDIAYCNHDIDDGIRAGFFKAEELAEIPQIWNVFKQVLDAHPKISSPQLLNESIRRLARIMIEDLVTESRRRIVANKVYNFADVKLQTTALIGFSEQMEEVKNKLKAFLLEKVYKHYKINQVTYKSKLVVQQLFETLYHNPDCLPTEWKNKAEAVDDGARAQVVIDYIAGMTDRYALKVYKKLCDLSALE